MPHARAVKSSECCGGACRTVVVVVVVVTLTQTHTVVDCVLASHTRGTIDVYMDNPRQYHPRDTCGPVVSTPDCVMCLTPSRQDVTYIRMFTTSCEVSQYMCMCTHCYTPHQLQCRTHLQLYIINDCVHSTVLSFITPLPLIIYRCAVFRGKIAEYDPKNTGLHSPCS